MRLRRRPRWLTTADCWLVALTLCLKLGLLLLGVAAARIGSDPPASGLLAPWARWDALHYADVAVFGYMADDPGGLEAVDGYAQAAPGGGDLNIVFPPLFPLLVRAVNAVVRDPLAAAFLVSGTASLFVGPLARRLVAADLGEAVGTRAAFLLLIFPTAYFLHIGYTESLFIALALGSLLAARRDHWWVAGGLAALAAFTRVNGVVLAPALMAEAFLAWRADPEHRLRPEWLAVAGAGVGFGAYLLVNAAVYADPLAFTEIQRTYWLKSFAPPWEGLSNALSWVVTGTAPIAAWLAHSSRAAQAMELAFAGLGVLGAAACAVLAYRLTWTVWMVACWLLFASSGFLMSIPRFTLVMFPLFAVAAVATAGRPRLFIVTTTASLLLLIWLASRFAAGEWAF